VYLTGITFCKYSKEDVCMEQKTFCKSVVITVIIRIVSKESKMYLSKLQKIRKETQVIHNIGYFYWLLSSYKYPVNTNQNVCIPNCG
jgi:hypothetical protein